jgi:hypothetical protein
VCSTAGVYIVAHQVYQPDATMCYSDQEQSVGRNAVIWYIPFWKMEDKWHRFLQNLHCVISNSRAAHPRTPQSWRLVPQEVQTSYSDHPLKWLPKMLPQNTSVPMS